MTAAVTGTMLRDLVQCERRVHHDLHSDATARDEVGEFVRMLWEGGMAHERDVLEGMADDVADLRDVSASVRVRETRRAMAGDRRFILGGAIEDGDRRGMPDVMERRAGEWVAGDVKSGRATEPDGRRPRKEYAVQVAHYGSVLASIGAGSGRAAFVIGRDKQPTDYDLVAPWDRSGQSIVDMTAALTGHARRIRDRATSTVGAVSATCKMCHWHSVCERELMLADDTTLVAGIGRAARDALAPYAATVAALADLDIAPLSKGSGKTVVAGLGVERLTRFRDRARLLRTPGATAYAMRPLALTSGHREIHFDIETDPMRDGLVYLHGFLIRDPAGDRFDERYHHIFAEDEKAEGDAFGETMQFLTADPQAHIYYFSKYERSSFRALADRHPAVSSRAEVDALFDPSRATDLLFDVIMPHTEWPTPNLSIKTLARHLGFDWRDAHASGAASIAWFDEYRRTGDPAVKQRILTYNHDDVIASRVVLDGLRSFPVLGPPAWPPINT